MSEQELTTIKVNMAKVEEKLDMAKDTSDRIEKKLDSHIWKEEHQLHEYRKMFEGFFEKADKKYASKRVETIFWGGLSVIGTTMMIWAIKILLEHGNIATTVTK